MEPIVPPDNLLLKDIIRIQGSQGADIGLQKIYDHIKSEHLLWIFSIKRLRTIRKDHNLAPNPPSATNANKEDADPNTLRFHLEFQVVEGRREHSFTFKKPIPKNFCEAGSDRQATYAYITRIIDECEKEVLATRPWNCAYCGTENATYIWSYPAVNLVGRPPSVTCRGSLPICFEKSSCSYEASLANNDALKTTRTSLARSGVNIPESDVVIEQQRVHFRDGFMNQRVR